MLLQSDQHFTRIWIQPKSPEVIYFSPILIPSKPPSDVNSRRPRSLTFCVGKVFERIINFGFIDILNILNKTQFLKTGIRLGYTTIDHTFRLEPHIKELLITRKIYAQPFWISRRSTTLCGSQLFCINCPTVQQTDYTVSGCILNWLKLFHTNRSFSILINNNLSTSANLEPLEFLWKSIAFGFVPNLNGKPYNLIYQTARALLSCNPLSGTWRTNQRKNDRECLTYSKKPKVR